MSKMKNRASSYLKQMITVLTSMAKSKTHALKSKTSALKTRIIIFSLLQRNNTFFTVSSINQKVQSLLHHHHDHPEPKHEVVEYDEVNGYESSSEASVVFHSNNALTHKPVPEETQLLDYEYAYELHQKEDDELKEEEKYLDLTDSLHEHVPEQTQLLDYEHAYELHQKEEDELKEEEKYPDLTHSLHEPVPEQTQLPDYELHQKEEDQEKYPDLTHSLFGTEGGELGLEGSVIELVKNSKQKGGEEFKLEDEIDQVADLFIKKFHHQIRLQKQQSLKRYQEMLQSGA